MIQLSRTRRRRPERQVELAAASPAVVDPAAGAVAFVRWLLERHGCATDQADLFYCPSCAGDAPSLRVVEAQEYLADGLAFLECAASCRPADVLAALGLRVAHAERDGLMRLSAVIPLAVA